MPISRATCTATTATRRRSCSTSPAGSWVATAKVAHAHDQRRRRGGRLALINSLNPNHLLKTTVQYKADTDPNTAGNQPGKWAERVLTANGAAVMLPPATVPWPNSGALEPAGDYVWVRFVYDATTKMITTWTSTNGTTFASFGAPISSTQYLSSRAASGRRVRQARRRRRRHRSTVRRVQRRRRASDPQTPGDDCGGTGGSARRSTSSTAPRSTRSGRSSTRRRPNAGRRRRQPDAHAAPGRLSRARTSPPQHPAAAGPAGSVDGDREARSTRDRRQRPGRRPGADLRLADPNYFAKAAIQYKNHRSSSGQPMNGIWAERVLTTNGAISCRLRRPVPEHRELTPTGDDALAPRVATTGRT